MGYIGHKREMCTKSRKMGCGIFTFGHFKVRIRCKITGLAREGSVSNAGAVLEV
jgi:hypothetical protein